MGKVANQTEALMVNGNQYPYGNNYKKKAATSQRFFMTFCALSSAKGMDIKMSEDKIIKIIDEDNVTDEELMAITSSGVVIRIAVDDIVLYGRATQGVIIMKVHGKDEKVVSITRVKSEENEDEQAENIASFSEEVTSDELEISDEEIIEETVE